jgi:hypothetical protein
LRSNLILSSHLHLGLPSNVFLWCFPAKSFYTFLIYPSELYFIVLNLITLIVLSEELLIL